MAQGMKSFADFNWFADAAKVPRPPLWRRKVWEELFIEIDASELGSNLWRQTAVDLITK